MFRRYLLEAGYSDAEILRKRRSGDLVSLRRGSYLDGAGETQLGERQRHALLVQATVAGLKKPAVISHCSAAVLLDIPLWSTPLAAVHITRDPPARTARSPQLISHVAVLRPEDIRMRDGVAFTSPARTVVDLARSLPFEQAVVAADAALGLGLTVEELAAAAARAAGLPGSRQMARVVRFADPRSESVGESRSRVMMRRTGLPVPTLQFEVFGRDGLLVGRTDFAWRQGRLLGEFDGKCKYGRLRRPGETAGDAMFREKRREDALRDCDARLVRWVWDELREPERLAARIWHALDRVG